jgi:uncharacterized protein (DUF1330 family)
VLARDGIAAYLVLMHQADHVDRYREEYLPTLRPFLAKCGAEVLVAGSDAEPAEGEPPNSTVVIQGGSREVRRHARAACDRRLKRTPPS